MSSILGALFAVVIGLLAVVPVVRYEHAAVTNQLIATTAGEFSQILRAANQYVQANYSALEGTATATTPATVTVPMLQNTGYLPKSVSALNAFGQTWIVQVLQPQAGVLQALVLSTGGQSIPQSMAPSIAAQAGQDGGGFVPYNGQYGTLTPSAAQGAYGGWAASLASYSNPGAGHLAGLVQTSTASQQQDYLYRAAVPGAPQLNTMATTLNMGGNNISNAQNVTAAGTVNAGSVVLPAGNTLHIAGQVVYGDNVNLALRTPGTVYLQNPNATALAPLSASTITGSQLTSTGNIYAAGSVSARNVNAGNAYLGGDGTYYTAGANSPDSSMYANVYAANSETSVTAGGQNGNYSNMWASPGGAGIATTGSASIGQSLNVGAGISAGQNITNNNIIRPGAVASIGSGCGTNGAIADDASGILTDCYQGTWQMLGGIFSNTYQTGIYGNGGFSVGPPSPRPMFIASTCLDWGAPPGTLSYVTIQTKNGSGQSVAESFGAGGTSSNNLYNTPSVSALIPTGDYATVTLSNAECSFMINY
jgi:hypothetical protein